LHKAASVENVLGLQGWPVRTILVARELLYPPCDYNFDMEGVLKLKYLIFSFFLKKIDI
jgi:hypothetical protein